MSNPSPSAIEEKVRMATQVPEPRPEFVEALWERVAAKPLEVPHSFAARPRRRLARPAWIAVGVLLITLILVTLLIGPQRVFAAVRQLLGYIPGVGIVDQSAGIRVLAEPVSVTRDGITVTVTGATLTADQTHLEVRVFGVPDSAYPEREDESGCIEPEYLRLPDGTKLEGRGEMPPVPAGVDEAVFVLPCIGQTLPGAVPDQWELPLRFVPAPIELTVMPVVELSPSLEPAVEAAVTPATPESTAVTFDRVIETGDGYILIGEFRPDVQPGMWSQVTGVPWIRDANGKKVAYTMPLDIQPPDVNDGSGGFGFVFQFQAAGLAYPLTVTFSGVNISQADPNATAEFEFDTGPNPQPGQEWTPNLEIQLAGHSLTLVSITADSRVGYSFEFLTDPKVYGAGVDITGYTPNGGGGGGGGGLTNGTFSRTISYERIPTGKLNVILSNLTVIGETVTWQGQWSPASPRGDLATAPTPQPGVCLTPVSLEHLEAAPADLARGKALFYEQLEGTDEWGLVLHSLDGAQGQVLIPGGSRGALSPDGSQIAYSAADGIRVMDLATGVDEVLQDAVGGYNLNWSPDGTQIAYVGGGASNVFVINSDGTEARQVSEQSYESIIGWAPDSAQIYVAIPFTGGSAWQVRAVDVATLARRDLFIIENGSAKALSAALSPDGSWIAYRSRDHSSLYLVRTTGEEMHLLMDKVSIGIGGIVWSKSGWLGVSLVGPNTDERTLVLLQPESCRAYILPALHGDLEGLYME